MQKPRILITDGAYAVEGDIPLYQDAIVESADGSHLEYRRLQQIPTEKGTYLLCRCGRSHTPPFCDYEHITCSPKFDGTETASRLPYSQRADLYEGNGLRLYDDGRCAYSRLCHNNNRSVWDMSREGDGEPDQKIEEIRASWHCPTGRLSIEDEATGTAYEQEFEPSIIVLEDMNLHCSGPLFVRGGIELVGQDGYVYETRNRYALCRCGHSSTMPFCDATHHHAECFETESMFCDGHIPVKNESVNTPAPIGEKDTSFEETPTGL